MRLALGHVESRAVYAFVHFRIADQLAEGTRSATELAGMTQTHERSLLRLLRASAALGLVSEETDCRFSLTPVGAALRTDAPGHASSAASALGSPPMWQAFGQLLHSVQTGEPVFAKVGQSVFSDASAEMTRRTSETMTAFYGAEPAVIAEAYDFSGVKTLVDVGGNSGNLLTVILRAYPALRGIVYDLPHVVPEARRTIETRSLGERCEVIGGSFFDNVPNGADVYMLSHVINDWPEEQCLAILRNIRRAISTDGRLLVIEQMITAGSESDQTRLLDLVSLTTTGGMHRTPREHGELLARTGFRLVRLIPTQQPVSIIEGQPV
jgi:hypothetical protein